MPCQQITNTGLSYNPPLSSRSGPFATEAECLEACKEGACCNGTTCSVKPQCQCNAAAGEVFKGVGTVCDPNPCNPCGCAAESAFPSFITVEFRNFAVQFRSQGGTGMTGAEQDIADWLNGITAVVPLASPSSTPTSLRYVTTGCSSPCSNCDPAFRSDISRPISVTARCQDLILPTVVSGLQEWNLVTSCQTFISNPAIVPSTFGVTFAFGTEQNGFPVAIPPLTESGICSLVEGSPLEWSPPYLTGVINTQLFGIVQWRWSTASGVVTAIYDIVSGSITIKGNQLP